MKKLFLFAVAGLSMAALASCSGKKDANTETQEQTAPKTQVYQGTLPAADCDGINYNVVFTATADNAGEFALTETYFNYNDTTATDFTAIETFETKGTYTAGEKDGINYLTLVATEAQDTAYFVVGEGTITLTRADLVLPSTPGLNYTLTEVVAE